ncbi:MAG: RodZ domain-containing protein [Trichlorobacter sp.]
MEPDQAVQEAEHPPQTPGPVLRRCREFHNMSIEDAAEATKIGKNYLRALEDDRHAEFASPAYRKGFLRIYAKHLGLHADELVQLLQPEQTEEDAVAYQQEQLLERGRLRWQRLVLPAVLLTAIIVLALVMRPADPPAVRPAAPTPVAIVQPPQSSAQVPAPGDPALPATPEPLTVTAAQPPVLSGVMVRLKALRKSNLVITMDESVTQAYELTAGDLIEWKADRTISLELSDPAGVELELNGKPFKATASPTITVDTHGVRR